MHQVLDYDGDLVIIGRELTAERYEQIVSEMPDDQRSRVIGWRRTGNN